MQEECTYAARKQKERKRRVEEKERGKKRRRVSEVGCCVSSRSEERTNITHSTHKQNKTKIKKRFRKDLD